MNIYELSKRLGLSYPITFLYLKQLKRVDLVEEVAGVEKLNIYGAHAKAMLREMDEVLHVPTKIRGILMFAGGWP